MTIRMDQFSCESIVIPENSINVALISGPSSSFKQDRRYRFFSTHFKAGITKRDGTN